MELKLVFGVAVDRRSVERVLGAVGDEIGFMGGERAWDGEEGWWCVGRDEDDVGEDGELESLEVEVAWDGMDSEADEVGICLFLFPFHTKC